MTTKSISNSEIQTCTICFEEIEPNQIVSKLNCSHQFHKECLQPWLDSHHFTCPLDRSRITSINGLALVIPDGEIGSEHVNQLPVLESRILPQSVSVIRSPSISSTDPVEHLAARIQGVFFSTIGRVD